MLGHSARTHENQIILHFRPWIFLFGCATNPTHPLPALADPSKAPEVVVMRGGLIWGSGVAANVTVDGYIVANLFTGKHVRLKLNPGEHSIGTTHGSAALSFEPNQKYYF